MASTPPPDLTLAGALLMAMALVLGPELAPYVSAYSVILMGWCAGLLVGVYRRPPDGRKLPVAGFAFVTLVAVIGVTVPASHWISGLLAQYVPGSESWNAQNLFLPVAAAIPAIGHNWADVGLRLYHLLRRRLPKEG